MDLAGLKLSELRKLQRRVETEIKRREDSSKRDLLKQMQRMAAEAGMSLEDVIGKGEGEPKAPRKRRASPGRPAKAKKITVAPKYRNPADGSMTWTGRGRKPLWVQKYLDEGMSLDQLLIPTD